MRGSALGNVGAHTAEGSAHLDRPVIVQILSSPVVLPTFCNMQELGATEYLIPLRFEGPNTTWDGHNTIGLLSKSEKDRTVTDISMSASIWLFFQHFFASRGQGCSNS